MQHNSEDPVEPMHFAMHNRVCWWRDLSFLLVTFDRTARLWLDAVGPARTQRDVLRKID
jgi:hypothetical protein